MGKKYYGLDIGKFICALLIISSHFASEWVIFRQMDVDCFKKCCKILGANRVVFGTDWPYKPVNIEIDKFYH